MLTFADRAIFFARAVFFGFTALIAHHGTRHERPPSKLYLSAFLASSRGILAFAVVGQFPVTALMRTIKTYFKRAPFYNALLRHVDYFRVARNSPRTGHNSSFLQDFFLDPHVTLSLTIGKA
jgi:hypothetical protein